MLRHQRTGFQSIWTYDCRVLIFCSQPKTKTFPKLGGVSLKLSGEIQAASYNSIEAASERVVKKIQEETSELKKLIAARKEAALVELESQKKDMSPEEYARRKALIDARSSKEEEQAEADADRKESEEKLRRREQLYKSAADKKAQAARITVASAATDEENLADAKAQSDAAKKARDESNQWISRIGEAQGSAYEALETSPEYYLRYGMSMSGNAAVALEQSNIANADIPIGRYEQMLKEKQARDDARTKRQKLLDQAGKEEGEANILTQSIPADDQAAAAREKTTRGVDALKTLSGLGVLGHPDVVRDIFEQGAGAIRAGQITQQQSQQAETLNRLMDAIGWPPAVIAKMDRMIQLHENTAGVLAAMDQRLSNVESRINAAHQ